MEADALQGIPWCTDSVELVLIAGPRLPPAWRRVGDLGGTALRSPPLTSPPSDPLLDGGCAPALPCAPRPRLGPRHPRPPVVPSLKLAVSGPGTSESGKRSLADV